MKTGLKCIICQVKLTGRWLGFCPRCRRAFDRVHPGLGTTFDVISWVAERVRRHERKRNGKQKGKEVREWLGVKKG